MEQTNFEPTVAATSEVIEKTPKTSKPGLSPFFLLIPAVLLCWGAYALGFKNGQTDFEANQVDQVADSPAIAEQSMESPEVILEAANPTPLVVATKKPVISPTASTLRAGWEVHHFPLSKINLAAPKNWQSDFQSFQTADLIRFWQGADASTATIQLEIKKNWDNTGDAQYLERKFALGSGIMAAQVDPPKMADQKLDRYQTNYYFEKNGSVYVYMCVHNWIDAQIDVCQTMLKTATFE